MKRTWIFFPFWIFLFLFKFAGSLHYTLMSPLGEHVLPVWIVGILIGAGSLTQLALDMPVGYLLDRYGHKRFLLLTTSFFFLVGICLTFGLTIFTFVLNIIFMTCGWLFYGPGSDAYVLSHAPTHGSGSFISKRDVANSIGVVVGSALLPWILPLSPILMGSLFMGLFAIAFLFLVFSPADRHKPVVTPSKKRTQWQTLKHVIQKLNPASTSLLLLNLSSSIFYACIWFVVPLTIAAQHNDRLLSLGLGMFDFAVVVLGFFLGMLADKYNKRTLVFFGLLLFAICGLLIGFHFDLLFLLLGFLATTGEETAGISLWSWLHQLDHEHAHDGTIASAISMVGDIGWGLGPMIAGFLFPFIGPTWTIVLGSVPIVITWIIYQWLSRSHHRSTTPAQLAPRPGHVRHRT